MTVSTLLATAALVSWGVTGHRTIGKIAGSHLSPAARSAVHELLGDATLSDISTWADEVRGEPEYRHTGPWHFINLPLGLSFPEFEAKVKSMGMENVYGALQQQELILGSPATTRAEKTEALKFVVHFVGDLHQPMHVSREEDKGGNTIQLNYDGKGTNLHSLWDSKLIDHEGLTYEQMAEQYDHATPVQIRQWQNEPLLQWIWESYQASSKLYAEVEAMKTRSIDDRYYAAHINIIHDRLEKAGIRLAGVLNHIFRNGLPSSASPATSASPAATPAAAAPGAATEEAGNAIPVQDAAQHYNELVKVCAKVYGIHAMESMTLVNLGAAYPNQPLTLVLRGKAKDAFRDLDGRMVCVTGTITSYRDRPEIVITDPAMIVASR